MRNGDLLECSEFFTQQGEIVVTESYNFHWQNPDGLLIKRWDNAPHHPELNGFPDHVHSASEDNVMPGLVGINLERVLALVSQQLATGKTERGREDGFIE